MKKYEIKIEAAHGYYEGVVNAKTPQGASREAIKKYGNTRLTDTDAKFIDFFEVGNIAESIELA